MATINTIKDMTDEQKNHAVKTFHAWFSFFHNSNMSSVYRMVDTNDILLINSVVTLTGHDAMIAAFNDAIDLAIDTHPTPRESARTLTPVDLLDTQPIIGDYLVTAVGINGYGHIRYTVDQWCKPNEHADTSWHTVLPSVPTYRKCIKEVRDAKKKADELADVEYSQYQKDQDAFGKGGW